MVQSPAQEADFPQAVWDGTTPNRSRRDDKKDVTGFDWQKMVAEMRSTQIVVTQVGALSSLSWFESAKSRFDPTGGLPVGPTTGDRYLSLATANGWVEDNIHEWDGAVWEAQIPIEGTAIWIDDENKIYIYQDGTWVRLAATISHGSLMSLGSDDHLQYMHISTARTITAVHTFNPAAPGAPFSLGANALSQLVTGLNADQLDGQHASAFEAAGAVATHEGAFTHANIHVKGADLGLDAGGANPVTAATIVSHIGNSANPHGVSKAQVGLSNVSDDAQLKIASNLSDINNATTARSNISAASTTHKDTHKSGGSDTFAATDLLEAVVKRVQVTGPVNLNVGAVADGEFFMRSGSAIIGGTPAGANVTLFSATVGSGGTYADIPAYIVAADASGATRYELHLLDNTVIISGDQLFKRPTDWYGVGNDSPSEKTVLSLFSGRILLNQQGVPPTSLHRFYNLNILKTGTLGQITIQDEQGQLELHNCDLSAQSPVTPIPMILFDTVSQETETYPSVKLFNCGFKTSTNAKYLLGTNAAGNGHKVRVEVHNCYPLSGGATTSILMSLKGSGVSPTCDLYMTGGSRFSFLAFEGQVSPAPILRAHVDAISFLPENKMSLDLGGSFFVTEYGGDRIRENSGPTQLSVTGIADGEYMLRSGTNIIGGTPAGSYSHPNHSGDVTSVGDGAQTIAIGAVTLAKMANIDQNRFIGRIASGSGVPESLTAADARTIIGVKQNSIFAASVGGVTADYNDFPQWLTAADASGADEYICYCKLSTIDLTPFVDATLKRPTTFIGVGSATPGPTGIVVNAGALIIDQNDVDADEPTCLIRFINASVTRIGANGKIKLNDALAILEFHNCSLVNQVNDTAPLIEVATTPVGSVEQYPSIKMYNCGLKTTGSNKIVETTVGGDGHHVQIEAHNCRERSGSSATGALLSLLGVTTPAIGDIRVMGGTVFPNLQVHGQVADAPTVNIWVDDISTWSESDMAITVGGSTVVQRYAGSRLRETSGPAQLDLGSVPDATFLKRVGTDVVGAVPPQRLHLEAATFDNPVTGHLINLPAPIAESPVNAGMKTRQFNQTEKGVSWKDRIPAGATTMKLRLMSNVTVPPAGVRTVGLKLYYRKITDGVAVAAWNGANDGDEVLDDIDIAVGVLPLEDEQTLTLGSLTPVIPADEMYQFELTRINPQAGTEYPDTDGVWELQDLEVEFA